MVISPVCLPVLKPYTAYMLHVKVVIYCRKGLAGFNLRVFSAAGPISLFAKPAKIAIDSIQPSVR